MQILIVLSCFLHSTPLTIAFGADFPQAVESGFVPVLACETSRSNPFPIHQIWYLNSLSSIQFFPMAYRLETI
ncbi:hypothetical protein X961_1726 [Burkholderia pseudomallei MSHR5613]|nr:hypothetical protein DP56_5740 [Burkholderia pseudomallei]KGS55072.1 hypothetical protein X961_1726 [Burkholderia pseudomallei MSHR5613]